jgi:hypothetical protein
MAANTKGGTAGTRNIPLPGLLKPMAFTPAPIVWKTVMVLGAIAVLLYVVWGPYLSEVRRNIATAVRHDPRIFLNGVPYVLDRFFHGFCCLPCDRAHSAFGLRSASAGGI